MFTQLKQDINVWERLEEKAWKISMCTIRMGGKLIGEKRDKSYMP